MRYRDITPSELRQQVGQVNFTVVDMRDRIAFNREHIPGAQFFTEHLIEQLIAEDKTDQALVIYCYHGIESQKLAEQFCSRGFALVYNLEGGWQAWEHYLHSELPAELSLWLKINGFSPSNLEAINKDNLTPLMLASKEGNRPIVQMLVDQSVDINATNYAGDTALWYACINGEIKIVNLLIHHRADVNVRNSHGTTPLMNAAISGKFDVLLALVDAGAILHYQPGEDTNIIELTASREITNYLEPLIQLRNTTIH